MLFDLLREQALKRVDEFFSRMPNSSRLPDKGLSKWGSSAHAGWSTEVNVGGSAVTLIVWVDSRYPFSTPRVALPPGSIFDNHPHIEQDGQVCFIEGTPSYAHRAPEQVLKWVLEQTVRTLSISEDDLYVEFVNEFQSYWNRRITDRDKLSIILLPPDIQTRRISYWKTKNYLLFADDRQSLNRWLENVGLDGKFEPEMGLYVWLNEPISPYEIPETSKDFATFLKDRDENAHRLLIDCIPRKQGSLPVLIAFETANGIAFATVILHEPFETVGFGKSRSRVQDGWSSRSKMPRSILSRNYLGSVKMSRLKTRRFDKDWINYRTGNHNSGRLSNSHVCLIGCGALGANLAYVLARAGVAKLTLIDHDVLDWNNVGRHLLGAEYVGISKSTAIRRFLGKQLPHLDLKDFSVKWQDVFDKSASLILNADVIVSTTGDWGCDEMLNLAARTTTSMPPVVFGWLEEFGIAGQALAVFKDGGCLSCGMTATGRFKQAATSWEGNTLRRAGACGEVFQPFGITELGPVTDTLARLTIDVLLGNTTQSELRSWFGKVEALQTAGDNRGFDGVASMQRNDLREFSDHVETWLCDPACYLCKTAS